MSLRQAIDMVARPIRSIERTQIDALFESVEESRVTAVTAPAGFGKTATVRRWADRFATVERAVLWIAARDLGLEPDAFLLALQRACPGCRTGDPSFRTGA